LLKRRQERNLNHVIACFKESLMHCFHRIKNADNRLFFSRKVIAAGNRLVVDNGYS
jgi:hypothetical protein